MRSRCMLLSITIAMFSGSVIAAEPPAFEPLFNGRDFTGWKDENLVDNLKWKIDDGAFHCPKSPRGGIHEPLTFEARKLPGDFELRFQWKAVKKGSNAYDGSFGLGDSTPILTEYKDDKRIEHNWIAEKYRFHAGGNEIILAIDNVELPPGDYSQRGSLYKFLGPMVAKDITPLEWHEARILSQSSVIQHWIDGQKVLDVDLAEMKREDKSSNITRLYDQWLQGKPQGLTLSLKREGYAAWYRNFEVRALGPDEKLDRTPIEVSLEPELPLAKKKTVPPGNSPRLSAEEQKLGFRSLCNDRDLTGWEQSFDEDSDEAWKVIDGAIVRTEDETVDEGGLGGLTYTAEKLPEDFELRLEWRSLPSKLVLPPGTVIGEDGVAETGKEEGSFALVDDMYTNLPKDEPKYYSVRSGCVCRAGGNWIGWTTDHVDLKPGSPEPPGQEFVLNAEAGVARPVGQWNEARIVSQGTVVQHWLNGQVVAEVDLADVQKFTDYGKLADQWFELKPKGTELFLRWGAHPAEYRNLRIRSLVEATAK